MDNRKQFLDKTTVYFYLKDLPIDIQHIDCDLDIPGDALPALLEFAFLQRDVKVIPHLPCRSRKVKGIDYAYRRALLMRSQQLDSSF